MAGTSATCRTSASTARCSLPSAAAAFTIVELLVVISVLAILIAILIPTLRAAAQASRTTTCLATIRGANRAIVVYTNDHNGLYPYLPERPTLDDAWDNAGVKKSYFDQFSYWPRAMLSYLGDGRDPRPAAAYCPWNPGEGRFRRTPPGRYINIPVDGTVPTGYYMSSAMFSNWRLWTKTPVVDRSVLVPVRVDEVTHPSKKLVLIEGLPDHLLDERRIDILRLDPPPAHQIPLALADGSARLVRWRQLTEDAVLCNPFYPECEPRLVIPWINTRNGARGRDLR